MWMKAMCSDWDAGSAKIRYSAAVRREHEIGRITPHGDMTALSKHRVRERSLEQRG